MERKEITINSIATEAQIPFVFLFPVCVNYLTLLVRSSHFVFNFPFKML